MGPVVCRPASGEEQRRGMNPSGQSTSPGYWPDDGEGRGMFYSLVFVGVLLRS